MGLRFRRSWSLFPGARFNLGMRGGSVSFGTRGLHYTVGTSGSRITAGLPGTGLFWTKKLSSSPWGAPQLRPNQQPGFVQAPGGNPALQRQQAQATLPQVANVGAAVQVTAPPIPTTRAAGGNAASPVSSRRALFPLWIIWTGLTVAAIAGLCVAAANLGRLVH
jgi:hypothetical protein